MTNKKSHMLFQLELPRSLAMNLNCYKLEIYRNFA